MKNFKIGLVGFPNAGKSSFFNLITKQNALIASYPFSTIKPNLHSFLLKDRRSDKLLKIFDSQKKIEEEFLLVDIAGIEQGASEGKGLGNKFLADISTCDFLCHIVRISYDPSKGDFEDLENCLDYFKIIRNELILSDISKIERINSEALNKKDDKEILILKKILEENKKIIESGNYSHISLSNEEKLFIKSKGYNFMNVKPFLILINYDYCSLEFNLDYKSKILEILQDYKDLVFFISVKEKLDNNKFEDQEVYSFFDFLREKSNFVTFFSASRKEIRAWLVKKDSNFSKCSSEIHSDMETGLIRIEVVNVDSLKDSDNENSFREKKIIKKKDEIIKDGDVCNFIRGEQKKKKSIN